MAPPKRVTEFMTASATRRGMLQSIRHSLAKEEVAMAVSPPQTVADEPPLVVRTHVTPWGFVVALPFALALTTLGAWALEVGFPHDPEVSRLDNPLWVFSIPLLGFALFLFAIGVGELARYLKPAIEVVMDDDGVTTYGVMGARRIAWNELVETHIDSQHISLRARHKGASKTLRLHFARLSAEAPELVRRIERHRPDLKPIIVSQ